MKRYSSVLLLSSYLSCVPVVGLAASDFQVRVDSEQIHRGSDKQPSLNTAEVAPEEVYRTAQKTSNSVIKPHLVSMSNLLEHGWDKDHTPRSARPISQKLNTASPSEEPDSKQKPNIDLASLSKASSRIDTRLTALSETQQVSPVLGSQVKLSSKKLERLRDKSLSPDALRVKRDRYGVINQVSGKFALDANLKGSSAKVSNFLEENRSLLGFNSESSYRVSEVCRTNFCSVRVAKLQNGQPVFGDDLVIIATDTEVFGLTGRVAELPVLSASQRLKMLDDDAIASAVSSYFSTDSHEKFSLLEQVNGFRYFSGHYEAVVKVTVQLALDSTWEVYVQQSTGQVIKALSLVYEQSSVPSAGEDLLGVQRTFQSELQSDGRYFLIDTSFPGSSASKTLVGDYQNLDESPIYSQSTAADSGWDPAAVSALVNSRASYEYFKNTFGRQGIDGADGSMSAFVHYKQNYVNAFYSAAGDIMVYGDGDGITSNSLAKALDVAGHELSHGVVHRTAGLEYEFQSGALNESFADFFGAQIDREDWLIGEDTWLQGPDCGSGQQCLRNMANPALSGSPQPMHMSEYANLSVDQDHGGVHVNSGIPNRAFFLLAEGLPNSLGRDVAEQLIYDTLLSLGPQSDFIEAAQTMVSIAALNSEEVAAVAQSAWDQVGIDVEVIEPDLVEVSDAITSSSTLVGYLYQDPESGEAMPFIQGLDNADPIYDADRDLQALIDGRSNSLSRISVTPVNGGTERFPNKGALFTYVTDKNDGTGNTQVHLDFARLDDSVGEWLVADVGPDPIDFGLPTRDFALSPNFLNDSTYALSIDGLPFIFVVVDGEVLEFPVTGPNYSEGGVSSSKVEIVDSLRWDPSARKVVFDYLICNPLPDGECVYSWSIGVLNLVTGISYPFASQPPEVDIAYPAFSNQSDRYIVFDYIEYSEESVPDTQLVLLYDTYEGDLYNTGIDLNLCGTLGSVWGSPSFTPNDQGFIHHRCEGDSESFVLRNSQTSYVNEEVRSVWVNDYRSEYPIAIPFQEYFIDARVEIQPSNQPNGTYYVGEVPYGQSIEPDFDFCVSNPSPVANTLSASLVVDGISSDFLPSKLLPGEQACAAVSVVPPSFAFENEPGFGYVSDVIESDATVTGGVIYALVASLPNKPIASIGEISKTTFEIKASDISSGGDRNATYSINCGSVAGAFTFSQLAGFYGYESAFYEQEISTSITDLAPNTEYRCEVFTSNRVGSSPVVELTVKTLTDDRDGDSVKDEEDAFPDDPTEWVDTDGDGIGNNADDDDDNDGYTDEEELAEGTDPANAESTPFLSPSVLRLLIPLLSGIEQLEAVIRDRLVVQHRSIHGVSA